MSGLTTKQEAFAQAIVSGMSQSDAYRSSFNVGATTKLETIHKRASELMAKGEVKGRVVELREPVVKAAQMTLESHLSDLKGLRDMATTVSQFSAAISAEVARGKAAGLYVEKIEANVTQRTLDPLKDDDFLG